MSLLVVHTNKFLSLLPPFLQQALFQTSPQPHAEQMWANAFWPPDKGPVRDPFSPTRQPQGHARQVTGLHGASEQTEVHTLPPVQASTYGFDRHYILTAQQNQNWRMETFTACPRAAGLTGCSLWEPRGAVGSGWAEAAAQDGLGCGSVLWLERDEVDDASVPCQSKRLPAPPIETRQQPPGFLLSAPRTVLILTEICTTL